MRTWVVAALGALALAGAAVAANFVLLGFAAGGRDPVGRLSPSAHLQGAPHGRTIPSAARAEEHGVDD